MENEKRMKRILVIAGSDCSGGAGLEADQKVIAAHGAYAMTATTALTAQNTQGVFDIHEIPSEFVEKQIDLCIEDIGVDVIKTGMLASENTVRVVANAIKRHNVSNTVIDPVTVSTSGSTLLPNSAIESIIQHLFPVTMVLTPNLPEAKLLLAKSHQMLGIEPSEQEPQHLDDLVEMARQLQRLGPKYVLLKGGHLPLSRTGKLSDQEQENTTIFNVLVSAEGAHLIRNEFQDSKNTHGTGCSLASAIASNLASGMTVLDAVRAANRYVEAGIKHSVSLGKGNGPINHFHSTYTLPFSPGHFIDYILERPDVKDAWRRYTEHEFVRQMADGTLPVEKFKYYLIQDYLFLIQFSRANALAAYKATDMATINRSAQIVQHIHTETALHISYCEEDFGISREQMLSTPEAQATTAYTRYVLDIGHQSDFFALQMALLSCLLGYGVISRRLFDDPETKREGNRYWKWIKNYVEADYVEAVELGRELVEKEALKISVARVEELMKIFIRGTELETGFWDMGLEYEEK